MSPAGTDVPGRGIATDTEGNEAWMTAARQQYGQFESAEELIRYHYSTVDPNLQSVLLHQENPEATTEANEDLDATAGKFDLREGEQLLGAAVRGHALVGVIQQPDGRTRKAVVGYTDKYKEPELGAEARAARAQAEADREAMEKTAELRAEAQKKIEQARREAEEYVAKETLKIQEDAQARVQKETEAAQKESEPAPATRRPR
jgi:hypothetical protein